MIALEPARPEDAAEIAALFSASRRLLTFLPELHSEAEDRDFIAGEIMVKYLVTVARREGEILGYMAEAPGWIEQLYLHPEQRRLGIGTALLRLAQSRQHWLELWCFAQNLPARSFYERHGFVPLEATDGAGNEAGAPDIRYGWTRPA